MTVSRRAFVGGAGALLASAAAGQGPGSAQRYFTDVALIDQNGNSKRLYSDLLRGKVIIANAFFTTCKDSCPVMAANFAKLQRVLGDRLGKDVYMMSLSVDPQTDTPDRLKAYAELFKAKPGWWFLTGPNIQVALTKFGLATQQKQDHLNLFIIGNERTGLWKKAFGMAPADQILETVQSVLNDRG